MPNVTFGEKLIILLLRSMRFLTAREVFTRFSRTTRAYLNEIYHLIVAIGLVILAIYYSRFQTGFIIVLLFYLTNETISWTLFDVLVEAHSPRYQGRRNPIRSSLWTAYSCLSICWIYAIYYVRSGDIGHFVDGKWEAIKKFGDAIYFSVGVFLTTNYGDLTPHPDRLFTKAILTLEPIVALIILAVYIAVFVSGLKMSWQPFVFEEAKAQETEESVPKAVDEPKALLSYKNGISGRKSTVNAIPVLLLLSIVLFAVYKLLKKR